MKTALSIIVVLAIAGAGCAVKSGKEAPVKGEPSRAAAWENETRDECLRAIRKARVDARNGSYRMYLFGPDRYDAGFARYLREYMKTRHGIELVMFGTGDRERSKCYSNEMDKIILNTFGPDILAEAEQQARELFHPR